MVTKQAFKRVAIFSSQSNKAKDQVASQCLEVFNNLGIRTVLSDNFRKVRDHENNTGWIHISQLSKKKAAIVISDNEIMFKSSTIFSNPVAILKEGRFVKINKCKETWCKVETNIYKGWIKKKKSMGTTLNFIIYFRGPKFI